MFDIRDEVRKYSGNIKSVRRELHRHPELGNKEWHTAERIENFLNDHGISTERKLGTAVIGRLSGAEGGMTIALRADMDALPAFSVAFVWNHAAPVLHFAFYTKKKKKTALVF